MRSVSSTESSYECNQTSFLLSPRDATHLDKLDRFGDLAVQVADLFVDVRGCEVLAYLSFRVVTITLLADTFECAATTMMMMMMMMTCSRRQKGDALFERFDATEHFRRNGKPVLLQRARAVFECDADETAESSTQLLQRVVVVPFGLLGCSVSP
jgi:hypothetical protein